MANNPLITDKSFDYITPNLDLVKLVKILERDKAFSEKALKKESELEGELIFRAVGNKLTTLVTTAPRTSDVIPFFDINHAVADPFRDADIDKDRIKANSTIDRDMIEKRNVLYLQNDTYAHILFLPINEEEAGNLASFLLRISHKGQQQPKLDKNSKIKFGFGDPYSMRDPHVIIEKESDQNKPAATAENKPDKKAQ